MTFGTVKWFNDAKGFGFIEPEGGGEDVFAHFSAIQMSGFRTLKQGEKVEFELTQGPKGQLAQNIRTTEPATAPAATQAVKLAPDEAASVPSMPGAIIAAGSSAGLSAAASTPAV